MSSFRAVGRCALNRAIPPRSHWRAGATTPWWGTGTGKRAMSYLRSQRPSWDNAAADLRARRNADMLQHRRNDRMFLKKSAAGFADS